MELREYWYVLRKRFLIVLFVPLIAAAVSAYYVTHKVPWYQVSETLLVNETQTDSNTSDTATYVGILQSQLFARSLDAQTGTAFHVRDLSQIDYSFSGQLMTMTIDSREPAYASKLLRAVAKTVETTDLIPNVKGGVVIDPPAVEPMPSHRIRDILLATVLALIAGIGFAFLREYLDMRLKSENDLTRFLNIPALGVIGEYKTGYKRKK